MGDTFADDDRVYGSRYHESDGEDLFVVAGRILSDLKRAQANGEIPGSALIMTAVNGDTISVMVHPQSDDETTTASPHRIRTVVNKAAKQYNWRGQKNRADVRFTVRCSVLTVRGRLDATLLGGIIG
jgi:hypothetical protein